MALGRRVGLYKFCGDIGRGNFSRVKLAVHQLTRDKVAIKVVDRGRLDTRALRMLSREVTTLECVHHPNILRLFEVVETLGRVHLVTEWIRGGELYNRITQGGSLKESHAAPLYKQLLLAVKHMHNLGFVHRDIKAENVLMVTEERIKLADFGFSTQLINGSQQHLDTFCGSPPYAAPELFSDDHYIGGPVDVWALGVLVYFMVVGNMPFRAPTVPALRAAVLNGDFCLPAHLSLPCTRLIQRILVHTPSRRPTIDQMLASQWVNHPNLPLITTATNLNTNNAANTNQSKKSNWFSRSRTMRRRATGGGNALDRHRNIEMSNMTPIQCNTKRASSIFAENFLYPIDMPNDEFIHGCGGGGGGVCVGGGVSCGSSSGGGGGGCVDGGIEVINTLENTSNTNNNTTITSTITTASTTNTTTITTAANTGTPSSIIVHQQKPRRSIFSGALKKKIGPMEDSMMDKGKLFNRMCSISTVTEIKSFDGTDVELKNGTCNLETKPPQHSTKLSVKPDNNAVTRITSSSPIASSSSLSSPATKTTLTITDQNNPFDEEQGKFIMTPTNTDDLTNLHHLEVETRIILHKLGISSENLLRAIDSGPRSDIIGAYRIIIHRLQKQMWLNKQAELLAKENAAQTKATANAAILAAQAAAASKRTKSNRTCAIL